MARNRHPVGQVALRLACFFLMIGAIDSAIASSLVLTPLRLSLTTERPVEVLTVRNDGDEPAVMQLDLAKWTQADGKDIYTATTDILATPPIFSVPAHGSHLVRVGLRRGADPTLELSYRMFLEEVPPPPKPNFTGLRVALRFGVPIFVAPLAISDRQSLPLPLPLQWQMRAAAGQFALRATNDGAMHVLVTNVSLTSQGTNAPLVRITGTDYVLPGQSRDWIVNLERTPIPGASFHIVAATDAGTSEANGILPSSP